MGSSDYSTGLAKDKVRVGTGRVGREQGGVRLF